MSGSPAVSVPGHQDGLGQVASDTASDSDIDTESDSEVGPSPCPFQGEGESERERGRQEEERESDTGGDQERTEHDDAETDSKQSDEGPTCGPPLDPVTAASVSDPVTVASVSDPVTAASVSDPVTAASVSEGSVPGWLTVKVILWASYAGHLIGNIWLVHRIQTAEHKGRRYLRLDDTIRPDHLHMLLLNGTAHVLHLIYTHIPGFYNGLARDTYLSASQASVINMLVIVSAMEAPVRGMFLGRVKVSRSEGTTALRRLHAYPFLFGVIFTFWYHPTEFSASFLLGFAHTSLLMLQGSLCLTRVHMIPAFRLTLEAWPTLHGSVVAIQQKGFWTEESVWPMFLFGFGLLLTLTQVYTLPSLQRQRGVARHAPLGVFCTLGLGWYLLGPGGINIVGMVAEPTRIPFIIIGAAYLTIWLASLVLRLLPTTSPASSVGMVGRLCAPWVGATAVSIVGYQMGWELALIVMMVVLVLVFDLLFVVSLPFTRAAIRPGHTGGQGKVVGRVVPEDMAQPMP
ncbi:hypothetical protein KIPB_004932 [Kipferlia bialata]|uniref:Uncharacterized protein n=1 Tax=Kipferlia bialata TaxID=797122 RepID=A0A9K3CW83_9EUKA|nr:hypothetical protein KIPB_004932 [Kipferlia bialata]|eukprot:g4932.t1